MIVVLIFVITVICVTILITANQVTKLQKEVARSHARIDFYKKILFGYRCDLKDLTSKFESFDEAYNKLVNSNTNILNHVNSVIEFDKEIISDNKTVLENNIKTYKMLDTKINQVNNKRYKYN